MADSTSNAGLLATRPEQKDSKQKTTNRPYDRIGFFEDNEKGYGVDERGFETGQVNVPDPAQLVGSKDPITGWGKEDTLVIKSDGFQIDGKIVFNQVNSVEPKLNIPIQVEITPPQPSQFKSEFDQPKTIQVNKWIGFGSPVSLDAVGEAATKTIKVVENVGKATSGAVKEGTEAIGSLFKDYILPTEQKTAQKPQTPEEQKEAKDKNAAVQSRIVEINKALSQAFQVDQDRQLKDALRIVGEGANMSRPDQNKLLGYQINYNPDRVISKSDSEALRISLLRQRQAEQEAQKTESINSGRGKPAIVLDSVVEGGTGGGKLNISSTGGGGVG